MVFHRVCKNKSPTVHSLRFFLTRDNSLGLELATAIATVSTPESSPDSDDSLDDSLLELSVGDLRGSKEPRSMRFGGRVKGFTAALGVGLM
jgi:hypothetical protein